MRRYIAVAAVALCAASPSVSFGQAQPTNAFGLTAPAELKKFEPFLGRYAATVDWPDLKWDGSLELAYVIKGWYVESNLIKETEGPVRHWRLLMTYDRRQSMYRVWRFETTPVRPNIEGVVRFTDNEFIAEWKNFPVAGGRLVTQRSRYRLAGKDLEIITEQEDDSGTVTRLGIVVAKRMP